MIEIKKHALEALIDESVLALKANPGFFCEDRFAIYCADGFQVQVVITADEDDFCDCVYPKYEQAL